MASIVTQNIGAAAAGTVIQPQAHAPQRENNQVSNPAQVQQLSQHASQQAAGKLHKSDKERGVQVPKKVEATFADQEVRAVKKDPKEEEKKAPVQAKKGRVDVTA